MRRTSMLRYGVAALLVGVVGILLLRGGPEESYDLRLSLDNAAGLRNGSQVAIGGLEAGKVELEVSDDRRKVLVDVKLKPEYGPVGKDVKASIASVNLLGQKRVELDVGNRNDPAPEGYLIPAKDVEVATDLDQVLGVLDTGTRERLRVLINETGAALAGRRADVDNFVFELPESFAAGRRLVAALASDNHTLADLVKSSNGAVGSLADERRSLGELVDTAGQAGTSLVTKRAELRAGLARTPGTLTKLRGFLDELQATSGSLGPAARKIAKTAPELRRTLDEIEPFRKAAQPAFDRAEDASEPLTTLATKVTPVVREATPVLGQLSETSTALKPVTKTLSKSANNLIGTVYNWSHAVQFRDSASRIFRGDAAISPDIINTIIRRAFGTGPNMSDPDDNTPRSTTKRRDAPGAGSSPSAPAAPAPGGGDTPKTPAPSTPDRPKGLLDDVLGGLLGTPDAGGSGPRSSTPGLVPGLLDNLLGGPR
jgi:virulence factor Mce-like protein